MAWVEGGNFVLGMLLISKREKCLSLTGDVDVELVLDILAAVVQDALVGALVLLLEVLHAQDDGAGLSVGPGLEAASLALGGQVFEPLFLQAHVL